MQHSFRVHLLLSLDWELTKIVLAKLNHSYRRQRTNYQQQYIQI
jgi:hypothetical protein